jgi:type IV pilus assembly protein PilX
MITRHFAQSRRPRSGQAGFVLITGLLFLVVLTMLGLAMFRSSGLMDRITANTRDKQRAFEASQSALQYAEWWIANGGGGQGTPCNTPLVSGNTLANVHTCSNPLPADFASTLPFPSGFTYQPPGLNVVAGGGGMSATNAKDVNYALLPGFYVEYLGLNSDGTRQFYQVTAYGSGGNADTASVVRSTYAVTTSVKPLDGL